MKILSTDKAPTAVGPYSQAVAVDDWVFCSGQIGLDTDGTLVEGIEGQMLQVMKNISAVLAEMGLGLDRVVKTTIYVARMDDYGLVNEIYGVAMGDHRPARSTVAVAGLPKGALVEIEVVAKR